MPDSTEAPLEVLTEATTPSRGHMISFSIFMASRTISTSPFFTVCAGGDINSQNVAGHGGADLLTGRAGAADAAGAGAAAGAAGAETGTEPVSSSSSTS